MQLLEKAKSCRDRTWLSGCQEQDEGGSYRRHGESGGDTLVYSLMVVVVCLAVCMCQNSPNCPFKRVSFTLCMLYLNKKKKNRKEK